MMMMMMNGVIILLILTFYTVALVDDDGLQWLQQQMYFGLNMMHSNYLLKLVEMQNIHIVTIAVLEWRPELI